MLPQTLPYTSIPWSLMLQTSLGYSCSEHPDELLHQCLQTDQTEIARIICAITFMYGWAWTSVSVRLNTCWSKHIIDFIPSEFIFPLKCLLIWLVWCFYSHSCLNTDGPIVLQSTGWMQLLWLKIEEKIWSSALQLVIFWFNMTFMMIVFLFFPGFSFFGQEINCVCIKPEISSPQYGRVAL